MNVPVESEANARLRTIIIVDGVLAVCGSLFSLASYLVVERLTALLWNAAIVMAVAIGILSALRPLRRGRVLDALLRVSIANWTVAIAVTWLSAFAWPLLIQAALLPAVISASFDRRGRFVYFAATSFVVAVVVACLGLLQDTTGLTAAAPTWLKNTALLTMGPPMSFLVILIALQHHGTLGRSLENERATNRLLMKSRQRVVESGDAERRRIERDLHDGAQSRLIGINLQLAAARAVVDDPAAVTSALDQLREEVRRAHLELRELSHGLYPTALTQHGITAAVQAAADRTPLSVTIDAGSLPRMPAAVEATVYFCVCEALQNAARHARATHVTVRLGVDAHDAVWFEVTDDGTGIPIDVVEGGGFTNMRDRLGSQGGTLELVLPDGGGASVRGRLPTSPDL